MTPSTDQTLHEFANLLPNWTLLPPLTLLPNLEGFYRPLQRVRLDNRGRLLLRTPGLVPFEIWIFFLILRPFFPDLVMSTDLFSFEHSSVLLFCLPSGSLLTPFISFGRDLDSVDLGPAKKLCYIYHIDLCEMQDYSYSCLTETPTLQSGFSLSGLACTASAWLINALYI